MAWTESATNTLSTAGGSAEDTLSSPTAIGDYRLAIDLNDMINGDVGTIDVYLMVRAAGTLRKVLTVSIANIQADKIWLSPVFAVTNQISFRVTFTAGTASLPWTVLYDAGVAGTPPTVGEIADAVWDEDATGHQAGGSFGQAIGDPGANTETMYKAIVTDPAGANIAADVIAIKTETASILDDTDLIDDGTSGLAKIATDVAAVLVDTGTTLDGRIPAALTGGKMESNVGSITAGVIAAASFAAGALDAVWSTAVRLLSAGTNIVLAKGVGVTGFNDLSAAQVNAEADTALVDYDAATGAEAVAIAGQITALNDVSAAQINAAIKAEGYEGAITFEQIIRVLLAFATGETSGFVPAVPNDVEFRNPDGSALIFHGHLDANRNRTTAGLDI